MAGIGLEIGDLVEPDLEECRRCFIAFRERDWPWVVLRVQGSIVTVLRKGYRQQFHKMFLRKVVDE
ncbi:MAG: hypothetical protein QXJ17_04545 [Nitrososphaeria archaeon]